MTDYTVNVPSPVCKEFARDILTVALEGGINYWANVQAVVHDVNLRVKSLLYVRDVEDGTPFGNVHEWDVLEALRQIAEGEVRNLGKYQRENILRALRDAGTEDASGICFLDADDCDTIVQIALLKEVVYG